MLLFVGSAWSRTHRLSPIKVAPSVRVEPQTASEIFVEPHLAVDPDNAAHLVGAAMKLPTGLALFTSLMAAATGRVMTLTIVMATLGLQLHLTGCVRCIHFAKSRGAPHECDPIARWWADLECAGCVRDAKNTPQDHPVLSVNTVEKRTPGTIYLGVSLGASVDHDKMVSPIGLFKSTDGAHSFLAPDSNHPQRFRKPKWKYRDPSERRRRLAPL